LINRNKLIFLAVVIAIATDVYLFASNKIAMEIASVIFLICCLLLINAIDFDDKA